MGWEEEVMGMLEAGVPFEDVESWIESIPTTAEYKAVLWLLAWAELPRAQRRMIVAA